ncbi:hypothetical protein [Streptomyces sp. NPDC059949]|uniref:hypothetical protein n=1 Tax=Streptomyces sp. NPDC059949 TaxID=3347013 RepID=UPI0036698921
MLAGELAPWDLTHRIHHRYGHDLALTARLVALDDAYGMLEAECGDGAVDEVSAAVTVEARRLAGRPHVAADTRA